MRLLNNRARACLYRVHIHKYNASMNRSWIRGNKSATNTHNHCQSVTSCRYFSTDFFLFKESAYTVVCCVVSLEFITYTVLFALLLCIPSAHDVSFQILFQQNSQFDQFNSPTTFDGCWSDSDEPSDDDSSTTKVLTWAPPSDLPDIISHFVVYRLADADVGTLACASEDHSPDAIAETRSCDAIGSERAEMTTSSSCGGNASNADSSTLANTSDLVLAALCTACATSRPPYSTPLPTHPAVGSLLSRVRSAGGASDSATGRWQCCGLTPANCFRATAPGDERAQWAVLPVSYGNTVMPLVRIRTDTS